MCQLPQSILMRILLLIAIIALILVLGVLLPMAISEIEIVDAEDKEE